MNETKDGAIYTMPYNQGKSSSLSAYVSVPVQLGKKVCLTFDGSFSRNYLSYKEDERSVMLA